MGGGITRSAGGSNAGPSGLRRVAGAAWSHAPAAGILAFVFALGVFAVDGYGIHVDVTEVRRLGMLTAEYVLGESTLLASQEITRCYGGVFQTACWAAERALGLTEFHDIYRSRYLFTHGFFLVGAFACYLLAGRLFKSRAIALMAMLFFVCHPRLYGHSFFNSSDTPFVSMFMIGLLLAHWALRQGGVGAFATVGAWLGLASTVRVMALLLFGLVAVAGCADIIRANRRKRIRVLASVGALAVLGGIVFFAGLPYLWGDPLPRLTECLALLSDHPSTQTSYFLGEFIKSDARPLSYVAVWAGVTTPPFVMLLALIGGLALCVRLAARPLAVLHDAALRFQVLLALCVLITVAVATFLAGNVYDDWRHLYFLYGPLCIGAAGGLAWLCRNAARTLAPLARTIAAVGLVPVIAWIALLHPHQHIYFNFLVDRKTPERLRLQFDLDYTSVPHKEALEALLKLEGHTEQIPVGPLLATNLDALPAEARRRFVPTSDFSGYFVHNYRAGSGRAHDLGPTYVEPSHVRKVFSNTLYALVRAEVDAAEGTRYRDDYLSALSNPPAARRRFNVHWDGTWLTYLRKDCEPGDVFFTRHGGGGELFVGEWRDPPGQYIRYYAFPFRHRGVVFQEGQSRVCMARVLAPRMEEPSAGEREGRAPRMEEPSAGEREGRAPRMEEPFNVGQWDADGTSLWMAEVRRVHKSEHP